VGIASKAINGSILVESQRFARGGGIDRRRPDPAKQAELDKWYREEHFEMLSRVPGWRRSRRLGGGIDRRRDETAAPAPSRHTGEHLEMFLAVPFVQLHEYAPVNGLGGDAHKAAMNTPWGARLMSEVVTSREMCEYGHHLSSKAQRHPGQLAQ
jgi:hypothetical protein